DSGRIHMTESVAVSMRTKPKRMFRTSRPVRLLMQNIPAMIALSFLVSVAVLAVAGGVLAPHDPTAQSLGNSLAGPSSEHWLGTDVYGRDLLSRLFVAAEITGLAVVQAVGVAAVVG